MYALRLSDHQFWGIESVGATRELADELAFLLGLEPMQGFPDRAIRLERLTMTTSGENGCRWLSQYGYPGHEWRVRILRSLQYWCHPTVPDVIFRLRQTEDPRRLKEQMRHVLFPVYESTVCRGGLPLHAALVESDGRGILLVGRSGVGKSTACRRLPPGWNVVCDDMALAVQTAGGGFRVHPLPTWSAVRIGSREQTWDINRSVRLRAIFFLTQAAEDEVIPAGKAMASVILKDAAMTVFNSVQAGPRYMGKSPLFGIVFSNAASIASTIPTYILHISLTGRFWEKIEAILEKEERDRLLYRGDHVPIQKAMGAISCKGERP
jgi:SynChlorMet cassette protein ScmC